MTALSWVTLIAGALSGGAIAYAIGYYVGRTNADSGVILASVEAERVALLAADAEKQKIAADAAEKISAVPNQDVADVIAELENEK